MLRFNLIQRIQRFAFWAWKQEGSPVERAKGIALGVFSGCFPFFGFQTLIGIALARLCKGNLLLAAVATWISNPVTYIPIFWLNYKVGEYFLGVGRRLDHIKQLSSEDLLSQGWVFSSRILLGSSVVGLILGIVLGAISYQFFKSMSYKK